VDPRCPADQQLRRPLEAEHLHLLGAEGRDADLGHPDRQVGHGTDLVELGRPVLELPVIPVEWKAVDRHRLDMVEHALAGHVLDERGIDRRDAAQHPDEAGTFGADGAASQDRHLGEARPVRVLLEGPMRLVVGLVPQHHGFDHAGPPLAG
jgi:hypothetical protein